MSGDRRILIVDDEPDQQEGFVSSLKGPALVMHPEDVDEQSVKEADLVVVDHFLDHWHPEGNVAQRPQNGRALAAVLRSLVEDEAERDHPVAFAIWSGRIEDIAGQLPPDVREHALARIHDLEWVFSKEDRFRHAPLSQQLTSLTEAVCQLPYTWNLNTEEQARAQVYQLLSIPDEQDWSGRAFPDVLECRAPLYELSTASHGLAFLRWLLHRILPYPCFLLDHRYLANMLRVSVIALRKELASRDSPLGAVLAPARYGGILHDFLGPRWWKAGVESLLWDSTNGTPHDTGALEKFLGEATEGRIHQVEGRDPVVCVTPAYEISDEIVEVDDAVRVTPDDWPAFADSAWAKLEDVQEDPGLAARVVPLDRSQLSEATDA